MHLLYTCILHCKGLGHLVFLFFYFAVACKSTNGELNAKEVNLHTLYNATYKHVIPLYCIFHSDYKIFKDDPKYSLRNLKDKT